MEETARQELQALKRPVVKLVGEDGNAFNIMARVSRAARRAGWTQEQIEKLMDEMRAGDYDHLLCTAMDFCDEEQTQEEQEEEEGYV